MKLTDSGMLKMLRWFKSKPDAPPETTDQIISISEQFLFREEHVVQTESEIKIHSMRIYQMALYPDSITEYEQYVLDNDMSIRRTYQKYVDIIKQKGY